jgi:hypothetical protein
MSSPELPDTESHPFDVKAITAAVYIACFVLACIFVKGTTVCSDDGWCITSTAPYRFRFIIPIFPALLTWLGMRRWLEGPSVQRDDLVVFFSLPSGAAGQGPRIGDLLAGLAAAGYTPRAFQINEDLRPTAPATGTEALLGPKFLIQEPRGRARRAFLRLALSAGPKGTGVIEVSDTESGLYAEMATYVVRDLASLLPDLKFRRLNSALPPEVGRDMKLPPRPVQLV